MNVFKKSVAALTAVVGSMVTSSAFAASPFYSESTTPVGTATAKVADTTLYRRISTPTGYQYVPVAQDDAATPTPKPAPIPTPAPKSTVPAGYKKVCTPTGCYLVKENSGPSTNRPVVKGPQSIEAPLFGDEPIAKPNAAGSKPKGTVAAKPISRPVVKPTTRPAGQPLPSPYYP